MSFAASGLAQVDTATVLGSIRDASDAVAFRIHMNDRDIEEPALPDFVLEKGPMVKLAGEWKRGPNGVGYRKVYDQPRYDLSVGAGGWLPGLVQQDVRQRTE